MNKSVNALNWFEIPAIDILRAKKFYETLFQIEMSAVSEMQGMKMCGFPTEPGNGKVSGAIVQSGVHKPSTDGANLYLNANPTIQDVIDRIESSGGKILMNKTIISPEIGYMAIFLDTEGNKISLHAGK